MSSHQQKHSRTPSPIQSSGQYSRKQSRSPTPTSSKYSKHSSRPSSSRASSKKHSHYSNKKAISNYPDLIKELDIYDCVLIFLSALFLFVYFSVDSSDIQVEDEELKYYNCKVGLKRLYMITTLIFLIILGAKKYIQKVH